MPRSTEWDKVPVCYRKAGLFIAILNITIDTVLFTVSSLLYLGYFHKETVVTNGYFLFTMMYTGVAFLTGLSLLFGIIKGWPRYMIPWIMYFLLRSLLTCFYIIWSVPTVFKGHSLRFFVDLTLLLLHIVCVYYITELFKFMMLSTLEDNIIEA